MTLKKIVGVFCACWCLLAQARAEEYEVVTDTIILAFGNNHMTLWLIGNPLDLKSLQSYNINQVLNELAISIDSAKEEVDTLTTKDNQGHRYLTDTTIIVRNLKSKGDDSRKKITVKVANYEIGIESIEDGLEEWDHLDHLDHWEFSDYKESEYIERRSQGTSHSLNVELGLNNWYQNGESPDATNAQYTIKPLGSWYVGLSSTHQTPIRRLLFLEWGGHLSWFNWKFDDANTRITKEKTGVVFSSDHSVNGIKSKLSATYINVHLVPMFDFSEGSRQVKKIEKGSIYITKYKKRGFRIGGGVYGGYRLSSHTKTLINRDGNRDKDKERGSFFMNTFRYGLRGQLGYRGYDFFINYDLNKVFADNKGPSLNAISFGIIL